MEVRKMKIRPDDEARLRELLKIHELEVDRYSDEELEEAERQNSAQLFRLLRQNRVIRFRLPVKSSAAAFIAAAAAVLFVQLYPQSQIQESQIVSKGLGQAPALSCESSIVESDGTTPDIENQSYTVKADKVSYLKLDCGRPVFVHVGVMQGDVLHIVQSNLKIAKIEKVVMKGKERVDFTNLVKSYPSLLVLVTDKKLKIQELQPKDREGLWLDEVPLKIK